MVDLWRTGATLGRLLVGLVETALALVVLLAVVLLGDLLATPTPPDSEGTIGIALLGFWLFGSVLLVLLVGGHALVVGVRRARGDGAGAPLRGLTWPVAGALVGLAVFFLVPVVDGPSGGFLALVAASFGLSTAVLLSGLADAVRFVGSTLRAG